MLLRRCLLFLFALLLQPFSSGQKCSHYSRDELLARLDVRITKCLGPSATSIMLSTLTERFVANEFDRRQPLALVLFSNSSDLLQSLAGALASSLFGSSRSPHTVRSVDFQTLLEHSRISNYDIKQTLRSTLVSSLDACPERSLFVLDNVQALDDATLPVLDVFLDPLNGNRAQFQQYVDGQASRVFDCINSVFLFLYIIPAQHYPSGSGEGNFNNWRELLMQRWSRSEGLIEEFTPQALVGRLTDAVAVFPSREGGSADTWYEEFKKSHEWRHMCELQLKFAEDEVDEGEDNKNIFAAGALSLVAENMAAAAPIIPGVIAMISIPAYLLILTRAKRWNVDTVKERGTIHRRRNSGSSGGTKRKRRKTRK